MIQSGTWFTNLATTIHPPLYNVCPTPRPLYYYANSIATSYQYAFAPHSPALLLCKFKNHQPTLHYYAILFTINT